jgi:Ras-related GTP-binding protein A/B
LIPNVGDLEKQLNHFARCNSAQEVVIFEKTTFLVICKSNIGGVENGDLSEARRKEIEMDNEGYPPLEVKPDGHLDGDETGLYPGRFGKISQQVKELRLSCQ